MTGMILVQDAEYREEELEEEWQREDRVSNAGEILLHPLIVTKLNKVF